MQYSRPVNELRSVLYQTCKVSLPAEADMKLLLVKHGTCAIDFVHMPFEFLVVTRPLNA